MTQQSNYHLETLAVHAGQSVDSDTRSRADYVRVSVGTERIDDIMADFAQALKAGQR